MEAALYFCHASCSRTASAKDSTANLGFEAKLWLTADKLWNNMDAAEYKHIVLGLIFLKYISDTFEEHRAKLLTSQGDYAGANAEDSDEPSGAKDKQRLGELINVIATIELTAASEGEKTHRSVDLLGRVYEYFLTLFASAEGKNGGQSSGARQTAKGSPQGERGGCFINSIPRPASCAASSKRLAPYKGRIYDPACGSGGMFVQS